MEQETVVAAPATSQERINHTLRELAALREEITAWIKIRRSSDEQRQYVTQLSTLETQLLYLLGEVKCQCKKVSSGDGVRTVYAQCRVLDRRLLWVRRLWTYFQSKFDQRYDDKLKDVLRAADDIVWSCYAQPFRAAGLEGKRPPHPLPFIAPVYSPYAIPRDEPPQDLRSDVDAEFLAAMLRVMPIPVVGIPPQSVDEPWRLAYLAHEVGHHVQFDFQDGALIESFGNTLRDAGGERWGPWGKELFADLFSLMMIGQWALWALAELVWSDAVGMLDDTNPRYPCALVRLMFMAAVADELGLSGSVSLRGLRTDELLEQGPVLIKKRDVRDSVKDDLKQLGAVARAAAGVQSAMGLKLSRLCDFDPAYFRAPDGTAYLWGKALYGSTGMANNDLLESSRLVLSGGVQAWAMICDIADADERDKKRKSLKELLPGKVIANREAITRTAAPPAEHDINKSNEELAKLLFGSELPNMGW
jgi:hypothetical protein